MKPRVYFLTMYVELAQMNGVSLKAQLKNVYILFTMFNELPQWNDGVNLLLVFL